MEQNIQEPKKTTILIEDLYKSYGEKEVLLGLNLEVHEGELFGFIGRNGIGKSTTIDCMIGAKKFNKGRIELNGYDIVKDPIDAKKNLGYVASEPTCYEEMTGYDYLEFVASIYGMTEGDFRRNSEYLCNRLQLNLDELNNPISDYSHGMKNKMQMLATVIASPEVILLDEPLTSLDVVAAHEMKEMLMNMKKDHIIIFSTHILQLAKDLCDEIVLLHGGKLAGVADEVYHSADFEEKLIQMLSAESDEDTENIDMWSADAGLYEQNLSDDKNRNEKDNLMTDGNTENHTQSDSRTDDYDPYDFD